MKRIKMTSFPEDLLIEILSLLPVMTLIRFRCVCKSWYALLQSPRFITKHLSNSDNNVNDDHHRFIVGHKKHRTSNCYDFSILSYKTLDVIEGYFRFHLPQFSTGWWYPRLLGCYNGLVCLSDDNLIEIAFWNPAIRQFKVVIPKLTSRQESRSNRELAFGYDFKTNDYKVMRITAISKGLPTKHKVEVCSFNTGSWRNSGAVIPDNVCFDDSYQRPTASVRGICSTMAMAYTPATNREVPNYFLFTFDMGNETFILTPMLEVVNIETCDWSYMALTELKGSVSFIKKQSRSSENQESFTVFILNEYGSKGIWTKIYTIAPLYGVLHNFLYSTSPIGFWKNNGLFIDIRGDGLAMCDDKTHEVKKLRIDGLWRRILEYKESLVGINDGNHCFCKKKSGTQDLSKRLDYITVTMNTLR